LKTEVENLKREITDLEHQNELNASVAGQIIGEGEKREKEKMSKRFDLFKLIREGSKNAKDLTGVEAEIHKESETELRNAGVELDQNGLYVSSRMFKRDVTTDGGSSTTDGSAVGVSSLASDLSIIGAPPMWKKLGVREYPGLLGTFGLPKSSQHIAEWVAEQTDLSTGQNAPSKVTLAPQRVGLTDGYTREYLAQTSPAIHSQFLADFIVGIERAVTRKVLDIAGAVTALTGYVETTNTDAVPTWTTMIDMIMAKEIIDGKFCMPRPLAGKLMQTAKDSGSGLFVFADGKINGYQAEYTSLFSAGLDQKKIIFADWSNVAYGAWGGLEIITDPYSRKKGGFVEVTMNKLADVKARNADGIVVVSNAVTS
jgi:hypothetical protein